jgi:hypothetical protein
MMLFHHNGSQTQACRIEGEPHTQINLIHRCAAPLLPISTPGATHLNPQSTHNRYLYSELPYPYYTTILLAVVVVR